MDYEVGMMIETVFGELGEIYDGYDGIYRVWIRGSGLCYVHHTKILCEVTYDAATHTHWRKS